MPIKVSSETDTVIKKIIPYLMRRGYELDDMEFETPTVREERLAKGFVDLLISVPFAKPALLIEAKRSGKKLSERDRNQALSYGKAHKVLFVVLTNGTQIKCYNTSNGEQISWDGRSVEKVPTKEQLKTVLSHLKKNKDASIVPLGTDLSMPFRPGLSPKQLNALFYACHSDIRRIEKTEERAFQDFSKLLFLKLLEEKFDAEGRDLDDYYSYRFHELADIPDSKADRVRDAVRIMLDTLADKGFGDVLVEPISLKRTETYQKIVRRLSAVSFMDSSFDSKGAAFEYYVRATLKGKKLGQYFTPRAVIHLMTVLIGRQKITRSLMSGSPIRVLDPACGTGGFLVYLMKESLAFIEGEFKSGHITAAAREELIDKVRKNVFFGSDANDSVASAAKMNMIIAGDGHSNIVAEDSLSAKSSVWSVKKPTADIIISNPPFGTSEGDSLDASDLSQFDITTKKGQLLFMQKMVLASKAGEGEICTVIDEGVLNTDSAGDIRKWIAKKCRIAAIVHLPEVTFKPNKINVRSSVVYLKRHKVEDVDLEQTYEVTFIDIKNIGYQGSGEPIRGFDESALMAEIEGYLFRGEPAPDNNSNWATFSVSISEIYADATCRLDYKYWDCRVRETLKNLAEKKAPTLATLALDEIRRGKSPSSESYVDEADGYALVVKAGTNISKFGELLVRGDYIEKIIYEEMPDCRLQKGDILLASTGSGTLGKCCVYRLDKPSIADGHVTIIRLDQKVVYPEYICDYLRLGFGATQVQRLFTGSTGLIELTADQVKGIFADFPTELAEQRRISKEIRKIESRYRKAMADAEEQFEAKRLEFFKCAPLGLSPIGITVDAVEFEEV